MRRAVLSVGAIVFAPLLAMNVHAATHDSAVTWSCDFEGTYCGMQEQSKVEPEHRSRFVSTARDGRQAIELNTQPGDDQVHGGGDWERDDLELAPSPEYCNEGQDEWWAVSVLFPDGYEATTGLGEVMDFHQNGSGGAPNFNVMAEPDGLRLDGYYGDLKNPGEYKVELGRIRRNVWYDFVYHVKWTAGEGGLFIAWLNGRAGARPPRTHSLSRTVVLLQARQLPLSIAPAQRDHLRPPDPGNQCGGGRARETAALSGAPSGSTIAMSPALIAAS